MKAIKEKPKSTKSKEGRKQSVVRSAPAISAKQAAKLMKDKYVRQLDQRQPETGSTETQAVDQMEGAGIWAVDELLILERPHSPRQRKEAIKERSPSTPERTEKPADTAPAPKPEDLPSSAAPPDGTEYSLHHQESVPGSYRAPDMSFQRSSVLSPSEEAAQAERIYQTFAKQPPDPAIQTCIAPSEKKTYVKERSAPKIKDRGVRSTASTIKERFAAPSKSIVSIESIHPLEQKPARPENQPTPHSAVLNLEGGGPGSQRSTQPGVSGAKTPPQRAPAAPRPSSAISTQSPMPLMQKAGRQSMSKPHQGSVLPKQQNTPAQQTIGASKTPGGNIGRQFPQGQKSAKGTVPKTRGAFYQKGSSLPKSLRPLSKTTAAKTPHTARLTVQRRMIQRTVQQVRNTVKAPAAMLKKTAAVVTRAAAALVNAIAVLVGGGILLLALVVVVVVAAVANSPFGLFFAQEPNAPGTVSVSQAVGSVNMAYNSRLELLQAGDYDDIIVQGQAASWPDILAVFAVNTAGANVGGLDVATLDADRVAKLTAVFWDMTAIAVSEETIDHPASGSAQAWTEKILHITITAQTADDMRAAYAFSAYQNSALDELLSDRSALSSLAGDLSITGSDVRDVLAALPTDLEQARQDTVQTALQLVGKVTYFWGGKSRVIGWDSRWGQLRKVTAAGNSTSGTYRPFGLDCSGFVDWTFNNSLGYIIGHGGGARAQHTYCTNISQSEAQPGDLAFYPDDSHVGVIVGRNAAGKLLVCHCSSGRNNVTVTEFSASGFTAVGRPDIFSS